MKRCASLLALQEIGNVTQDIAEKVRSAWRTLTREQLIEQYPCARERVRECFHPPGTRELRRVAINSLIETHGIEYLGTARSNGEPVYYCNSGDTYDATVIFCGDSLRVACWGDMVERKTIKERE